MGKFSLSFLIVVLAFVASMTEARLGSSSSTEVADVVEADVEDFEVGAEAEAFEAEERELQRGAAWGGWDNGNGNRGGAVGWNDGYGNRGGAVAWNNGNGNRGWVVGGVRGNGRQRARGNGRGRRGNHGQGGYYESDQRYSNGRGGYAERDQYWGRNGGYAEFDSWSNNGRGNGRGYGNGYGN